MILLMFGIGIALCLGFIFLGLNQSSAPFLFLGFAIMLILGLFIMSDGLQVPSGAQEFPVGSHTFITTYTNYTMANDPVVNILGNFMFYFPFAALFLSAIAAIYYR